MFGGDTREIKRIHFLNHPVQYVVVKMPSWEVVLRMKEGNLNICPYLWFHPRKNFVLYPMLLVKYQISLLQIHVFTYQKNLFQLYTNLWTTRYTLLLNLKLLLKFPDPRVARGSGRVGSRVQTWDPRVGSGPTFGPAGRVGSDFLDPCPTLVLMPIGDDLYQKLVVALFKCVK